MLILLSPAKIMNFKPEKLISEFTLPEYLKDAGKLIELLRNLNKEELSKLLEINSNLTDLNLLESKIKEAGHLPGIPSEKEVKSKGINLGEMDAKLLQKIEELTLYVIELKKEINQLKNEKGK